MSCMQDCRNDLLITKRKQELTAQCKVSSSAQLQHNVPLLKDPVQESPFLAASGTFAPQQHGTAPAGVMAGSRYPRRNRNTVLRPDSAQGSGQAASSSKDQDEESGSEQAGPSGEEEEDSEEEQAEEEEQEERKRYQLRERRPIQPNLYQPSFGGQASRQALSHGRHHGPTDALPWEIRSAGAGADPSGAAGPGGSALQPWGDNAGASATGASGHERSGNAEITPLEVDPSVSFDQVGGLEHYIKALKEMVFLPLVYPELFERFHLSPPRGVLFYGPPGTGKTLVARALAATASKAGTKVSFFMRKGADVLSKWVGEAERQLRLLFEEAQKAQPSIIFFDEIDGLAPVRSSKQDQIHNSIVSTLLALMDGLDSRGQVVVIGATNRLDALDGALRRPGRFDRELVFPLPNLQARASILDIHTRKWNQPPAAHLKEDLAHRCVGYCGADLKALCTEASLHALRRQYPQIYDTHDKLVVDPATVRVPLPAVVMPCLGAPLATILGHLNSVFPPAAACLAAQGASNGPSGSLAPSGTPELMWDDDEEEDQDEVEMGAAGPPLLCPLPLQQVQRPRLLICGEEGSGQSHLGPALLYALEGLPVHALGLPSLLSDASARSPEEAVVHAVLEARRASPAILFLPHLQLWWDTAPASLRATLTMLLSDLPPELPLLLLATADVPLADLDADALKLFGSGGTGMYALTEPTAAERTAFFSGLAHQLAQPPRPNLNRKRKALQPPQLPRAPEAVAAEEEAQQAKREQHVREEYSRDVRAVTELRRYLRKIVASLIAKSKYTDFLYPMSLEDNPEAYYKVQQHMDLGTLLHHVDHHMYSTCAPFLADVALIPQAWTQYYQAGPADGSPLSTEAILMPSKARQLADDIRGAVASLPSHLDPLCQAIAAKGGPKPPSGMAEEAELWAGPPATTAGPVAPKAPFEGVSRSSKRLRGEMVNKLAVYDDPELLRRRIRQATQGDSGPKAAAKPPRAVHFQQAPSDHNGLDAMEEEAQPMQRAEGEQEEQILAETPGVGPAAAAGSAGSGLKLMLSTSAAQQHDSRMMDEEEDAGVESHQTQVLHTASSSAPHPPDTTGKVLATSKDSLRKALDIAQGILRSDSEGAAAGPADAGDNIPARPVMRGASKAASPAKTAAGGVKSSPGASSAKRAAAGAKSSQAVAAELAHLPECVNANDASASQQAVARAHLEESPPRVQSPRREVDPGISVLASTTRPNMPRKVGGSLAQLKAASSPGLRVTHAGHTPHPSKSRMFPADQPSEGTPHGSTGQTEGSREGDKDQEGATPAVTLRPFEMSLGPAPFSTTAGSIAYPSSNDAPIDDTPMAVFGHAMPFGMVPDSCVGQMASGRVNQSMQSVAKRSPKSHPIHVTPHLSPIEEGDVEMAEQSAGCELHDTATDSHVEMAASSPPVLEPRLPSPEDVQHAEAFQAQLVGHTSGMVLDRLEEIHSALTRLVWQHRHNPNRKQTIEEAEAAAQAMLQHATTEL
ncbi:MAG: ATPase family AAA domain-containing protein [Trebouxia sp. A1-2]|nr:MAG: ATPase family AAA domain-containing protein [Trebouxia sp. A1-2]